MAKASAKQNNTRGSPASKGPKQPRSAFGKSIMISGRKAGCDSRAIAGTSLHHSEPVYNLRSEAVKRKATEGAPTAKRRRLSSTDKESCNRSVEKVAVGKRKANTDGKENSGKKRRLAVTDTKQTPQKEVSVDSLRESGPSSVVIVSKKKATTNVKQNGGKKRRQAVKDTTSKTQEEVSVDALKAEFEAKYEQQDELGKGGCGFVYAGYRKEDNLPVAIKRIPENKVLYQVNDAGRQLPIEVAVMLRLQEKTSGSIGAPVLLLDWYDLGQELILVHERPVPCEDLLSYIEGNGGSLPEEEAQIIIKQLVNAAIKLQDHSIFHRDIKLENILIKTDSEVPRVRLIDFGLSRFVKNLGTYSHFCGTSAHCPPEWKRCGKYSAGPTTVWQMGVVLFEMLHDYVIFTTTNFLDETLTISDMLSEECQNFLEACLTENPDERPSLKEIRRHPWLN